MTPRRKRKFRFSRNGQKLFFRRNKLELNFEFWPKTFVFWPETRKEIKEAKTFLCQPTEARVSLSRNSSAVTKNRFCNKKNVLIGKRTIWIKANVHFHVILTVSSWDQRQSIQVAQIGSNIWGHNQSRLPQRFKEAPIVHRIQETKTRRFKIQESPKMPSKCQFYSGIGNVWSN